jgi:hypothetical protein
MVFDFVTIVSKGHRIQDVSLAFSAGRNMPVLYREPTTGVV